MFYRIANRFVNLEGIMQIVKSATDSTWEVTQVDQDPFILTDETEVNDLVAALNADPKAEQFSAFAKKAMDAFDKIMEKATSPSFSPVAVAPMGYATGRYRSSPVPAPMPSTPCTEDQNCFAPYVGDNQPYTGVYHRFVDDQGRLHQHRIGDGVDEIGQILNATKPETAAS